ncbi:MAG: VCBS repeat-containing protein [Planctomycetaceae bacterium]|nr:VCBS repeat-containing protein [Planctomycetaceae bacterium]
MKTILLKFGVPVLLVFLGLWYYASKSGMFLDQEALLAEAASMVETGDLDGAEQTIQPLLKLWDVPNELWLFVANINRAKGDFAAALSYLNEIEDATSDTARLARIFRAEALLQLGQLKTAKKLYETILTDDASRSGARRQLVFLLNVTGLIRESLPHILALVKEGRVDPELLLLLCDTSTHRRNDALVETGLANAPEDPLVQMAAGLIDQDASRPDAALKHFQSALQSQGDLAVAWVKSLEMAVELREGQTVRKLLAAETAGADRLPGYWQLKGDLCRRSGMTAEAARCYWEAAKIAPDHIASHFQLGQMLRELGRDSESQVCSQWASDLSHLEALSKGINKETPDIPGITKIAEQLLKLRRVNEARAWVYMGRQIEPNSLTSLMAKLEQLPSSPSIEFPAGPAANIDLSTLRDPEWDELDVMPKTLRDERPSQNEAVAIRFEDVAAERGLQFEYVNGGDPATEGRAIYEYTGGGVGILDYDLDGWPDLYLAQGLEKGPHDPQPNRSDQLYRNSGGTRYQNITEPAGIAGFGFGQGVAIGDIDNDGFPDIYVGNFGRNQLWRNNGDGTFTDITESAGIEGESWTTSCAIADLNGDGLPELYDVDYLTGENLLTQTCYVQGIARVCTPVVFSPAQDRVWKNRGAGRFSDETNSSGLNQAQGNGLGVLVADFDGDSRPDIFVANDAVANHYWVNQSDETLKLEETALLSGAAMNSNGRAEACMGIAAGDVDGNGILDLFVTNFYQESNTLYRQQQPHLFLDQTDEYSLRDPGYELLGFGTQFLDADLDGWPDLVVLNGDIDDFSFMEGRDERMPPLLLRNQQGEAFVEQPGSESGAFFEQKFIGRSLARLDWNRDGKPDFVASALDSPTQLAENRTETEHRWITLRLVGVNGSRDAVGTRVTIDAGGRQQTQQLTTGDGYQCNNEKRLFFGLADAEQVDEIKITWPHGETSTFGKVGANQHLTVVEGEPRLLRHP